MQGAAANDAVVARALAAQPVVLEYAAPLLKLGGALVDWRGRRNEAEEAAAAAAAQALGMSVREIRHVQPFAQARDRHVHVFVKCERDAVALPAPRGHGAQAAARWLTPGGPWASCCGKPRI